MSAALVELCFGEWSHPDDERVHTRSVRERVSLSQSAEQETSADDEIVRRLEAGDVAAFDALFHARFPKLVAFAAGLVGDRAIAEDAVQDVLARLWEQCSSDRGARRIQSLTAYLYRAVRNHALDALRRDAMTSRLEAPLRSVVTAELEARTTVASEEAPDPDERVAVVRAALARLPERRRSALQLRYEQELSYDAIAEVLGISTSAAQQLVFHAIRALRRDVSDSRSSLAD